MKTIKKAIAMVVATGITVCSFAQLNLGLQSTTQAAVSTAINTAAVTNTTNAATQATKNTVSTAVNKIGEVKSIAPSVNANAGVTASSQASGQSGNGAA